MNKFKEAANSYGINTAKIGFFSDPEDYDGVKREVAEQGFIAGAKYASAPVQRLGEIIQQYSPSLPRHVVEELRVIFELNKEIADE